MFKSINSGKLPERATKFSAGFDVFSNVDTIVEAGSTSFIPLGIAIDLSNWEERYKENVLLPTHYLALHIRSSLRARGLTSLGTGIIDMDYEDEIMMIIHNPSKELYAIGRGSKIGQLIICRHEGFLLPEYTKDDKRVGGFGSTGA